MHNLRQRSAVNGMLGSKPYIKAVPKDAVQPFSPRTVLTLTFHLLHIPAMFRGVPYLPLSVFSLIIATKCAFSAETFWPAAVPLAVRSPYFSAWQGTTNGTDVTDEWTTFWFISSSTNNTVGWAGHIRIDGDTYRWLGAFAGLTATTLMSIQVTPTRTIYSVQAGPMDLNITFFTPIEPSNWVRQSIPFSYVALEARSNDGEAHDVQVYSDVSSEWLSRNRSAYVQWNTAQTQTSQVIYHTAELESPSSFTEMNDQASDGRLYYAMAANSALTYQAGPMQDCREQFIVNGYLANTTDTSFQVIDEVFPIAALSLNLGKHHVHSISNSMLRRPYYVTQYLNISDLVESFVLDFSDAQSRAESLDNELMQNASSISSQYSDLISLAARQAFGGIDITVSNETDGNWNTSDVMIFMKNMGTDSRVNPVEILYASFPMFLYLNASFGKSLLAPLFEYQSGDLYTLPYAARDLGQNYPIASGDNTTSFDQGVEQSGNMLIMTLAHARASGDGSLIGQYVCDLLMMISADSQSTANMTNLAIKGNIGIQAMAEISQAYGNSEDEQHYASTASTYISKWQTLALSANQDNFLFSYGAANSWALMYNFYADRLLQTGLINDTLYERQSNYYQELSDADTGGTFGLPIDSIDSALANSGWLAFTAATTSNTTVRDNLIDMIWKRASYNLTAGVWPSVYSTVGNGSAQHGTALPAQGAMFALLALNMANKTIEIPPSSTATITTSYSHTNVGAIVGGVVGGVAGLAIVLVGVFLWRQPVPFPYNATPYGLNEQTGTESTTDPPPLMSSKSREHMNLIPHGQQNPAESTPSTSADTSMVPTSGQEPASTSANTSTVPTSGQELPSTAVSVPLPSEMISLRAEVNDLRRFMAELQADRIEAPPSYDAN
ncbi:uncharacterized protein LAESUDRAFT_755360 [Laetiporus sulphureus 93-53]|uniref:DUF1793-domain-containing protein n=1 Tax=Laetiporus sulphureus 93-53 TaxID=1314785 RepID=A0A165GQG2_9APHY|nr:uncharacterized protein LAESUDRAFT_755360 [Laetiporus sulphureus 93-53]KZT10665.1 hypothetical protein LAESUDRAFT_755360 [Laetiporus sulphureus 93-53]